MKYLTIGFLSAVIMNQNMLPDVQGIERFIGNMIVFIFAPIIYAEVESLVNERRGKHE